MGGFVTSLATDVDAAGIWGAIAPIAPLIGVAVLVGVGVTFLRRVVSGLGKGKAKI